MVTREREKSMKTKFTVGDVVRVGLDGKTVTAKILAECVIRGALWYNVEAINSVGYVDFGKVHTKWVKANWVMGW